MQLDDPPMQLDDTPIELDEAPIQLGALERNGLLSLSTLDDEPAEASPSTPASPAMGLASNGAASPTLGLANGGAPPPTPARRGAVPPLNLFAPPGADLDEVLVELADDELEWTRKRMSAPPGSPPDPGLAPALQTTPATSAAQSSSSPSPSPSTSPSSSPSRSASPSASPSPLRPTSPSPPTSPVLPPTPPREPKVTPRIRLATQAYVVRSPRARVVAGVVLAILLGFVPAHIVASLREDEAYRPIDVRVIAAQAAVDSQASYDALEPFRADQLDAKRNARNTIALTAMLIWFGMGGTIAYLWFRRVPWARLGA